MTKIVYNACYGGFGLSHEAVLRYAELQGLTVYPNRKHGMWWYHFDASGEGDFLDTRDLERNDPALIQVVEELGSKANGDCAGLRITDLCPGTLYRIEEYDGLESVVTEGSQEWKVA